MRGGLAVVLMVLAVSLGCDAGFQIRPTGLRALDCIDVSDCDDRSECTGEDCIGFRCIYTRYDRRCEGSVCLGPGRGCFEPSPCSSDQECVTGDPCVATRCVSGACVATSIGDADGDGDVVPACGGGDCDDTRDDVSVFREERCDGVDDDCDGGVDEGETCGLGVCVRGVCECMPQATLCAGSCVDLLGNTDHCGACGERCALGARCVFGMCDCPGTFEECAGVCQLPGTTRTACGACRRPCAPGAECIDAACVCPEERTDCGGACADLATDRLHCGACASSCMYCQDCVGGSCFTREGYTLCAGRCADVSNDHANCGACGNACERDETCESGVCVCGGDARVCDGTCTNVLYDPLNCGGCGVSCGEGGFCAGGACVCTSCPEGCFELTSDPEHCGACDEVCSVDASCIESTCASGVCLERVSTCVLPAREDGMAEPPVGACERWDTTFCGRAPGGFAGAVRLAPSLVGVAQTPLAAFDAACVTTIASTTPTSVPNAIACVDPATGSVVASRLFLVPRSFLADGARAVPGAPRASIVVGAECPDGGCYARLDSDRGEAEVLVGGAEGSVSYFLGAAHAGDRWSVAGAFSGEIYSPSWDEAFPRPTSSGGTDALVFRLVPSPLVRTVTVFGGTGDDVASDVAVLGTQTFVVGHFEGALVAPYAFSGHGGRDAFVAHVAESGSVTWIRGIGGAGDERALAVEVMRGSPVIAGTFSGTIDVGAGTTLTSPGPAVFVVALDILTAPRWARAIPARAGAPAYPLVPPRVGLATTDERVAVAVSFSGTLTLGSESVTSAGGSDIALVVYDATGNLRALRSFGGANDDEVVGVGIDARTGTVWVSARVVGQMTLPGAGVRGVAGERATWLVGWTL